MDVKIIVVLLSLLAFVLIATSVSEFFIDRNDSRDMKVCVENGGQWKRDRANYYECVRD